MAKAEDLTGRQFGELTVLYRDFEEESKHPKKGSTYWKCKCSCGNEKSILRGSLISGATKSCGCLRKKIAAKHMSQLSANNYIDELGHQYGKLTVIKKITNDINTRSGVMWQCQCECGNIKNVLGVDLRAGNVTSCGCMGTSKGEYLIEKLLTQNNISFAKEFVQAVDNHFLRFDFAVFENNQLLYFIEFDGKQHFHSIEHFGGDDYLSYIQSNDNLKNIWCKNNNIPLIRIPYTHYDKLSITDLLLNTSQFIL